MCVDDRGFALHIIKRRFPWLGTADKDDAIQEALIALWDGRKRFDESKGVPWESFATLVVGRTLTLWYRVLMRRGFSHTGDHPKTVEKYGKPVEIKVKSVEEADSFSTNEPIDYLLSKERAELVRAALKSLPESDRKVLVEIGMEGRCLGGDRHMYEKAKNKLRWRLK